MEKKMLHKSKLLFFLLLCTMLFGACMTSQAAANVKKLSKGRTYSSYLTGTTKHTIKYTYTPKDGSYNKLNIYVDGKRVKTLSYGAYDWDVSLVKVASKRVLLSVRDQSDNDYNTYMNIYEYKSGKLKLLKNLASITRNSGSSKTKLLSSWARGSILKAGPGKIVVRWTDTALGTGIYAIDVSYKVSGNSITRLGTTYTLKTDQYRTNKWTVKRAFTAYTTAGGSKTAFQATVGSKVTALKMTRKNGVFYFMLRNANGKTGWLKDAATWQSGAYFNEALFAG